MILGCCFFNDGTYSNSISLKTTFDVLDYIRMQVILNKEARILDDTGQIIIQIIDGKIIIP